MQKDVFSSPDKNKNKSKTVHFLYTFFKQKKYIDIFCLYIVVIVVSKTLYGWGSWIRIKERLFRQYSGGSLLTGSRIQSALVRFGTLPKVLWSHNTIQQQKNEWQTLTLAGVAGFEPADDGFRDRSLTTWRYPNML